MKIAGTPDFGVGVKAEQRVCRVVLSVTARHTLPVILTSPQTPVSVTEAADAFYIQLLCLILKGA